MNLQISTRNANHLKELARVSCGFVTCLAWSPDGGMLAVAHGDGVSIWAGGFGGAPTRTLTGHGAPVKGIAFSPNGRVIASAGADTTVRLWDSATGQPLRVIREHKDAVNAVAFSADGRLLASGAGDGRLLLSDLAEDASALTLAERGGEITSVVFSGGTLASGGWDKTVRLWDAAEGRQRAAIPLDDWIRDLAASPDGTLLAAACKDGAVRLIDFASGALTRSIQAHAGGADCAAFSPDGSLLATGGRDHLLKLWDVRSSADQPLAVLEGHSKPVLTTAFHPGGGLIASGSGDNSVRLWGAQAPDGG